MMLGFLLARMGVDVVVLEKHDDFLRDFRGDTIHPSTLELMHELGILDEFLKRPHQEVRELSAQVGGESVTIDSVRSTSGRQKCNLRNKLGWRTARARDCETALVGGGWSAVSEAPSTKTLVSPKGAKQ